MLRVAPAVNVPAHIEVAFEAGVPVAVNGIPMALHELTESLATIAADHGIGAAPLATPGDLVLDEAREALAAAHGDGVVRMKLHLGEHTVVSVSPAPLARS